MVPLVLPLLIAIDYHLLTIENHTDHRHIMTAPVGIEICRYPLSFQMRFLFMLVSSRVSEIITDLAIIASQGRQDHFEMVSHIEMVHREVLTVTLTSEEGPHHSVKELTGTYLTEMVHSETIHLISDSLNLAYLTEHLVLIRENQ